LGVAKVLRNCCKTVALTLGKVVYIIIMKFLNIESAKLLQIAAKKLVAKVLQNGGTSY